MTKRAVTFSEAVVSVLLAVFLVIAPTNSSAMLACDMSMKTGAALNAVTPKIAHAHNVADEVETVSHAEDHCASHICFLVLPFEAGMKAVSIQFPTRYSISPGRSLAPSTTDGIERPPRTEM